MGNGKAAEPAACRGWPRRRAAAAETSKLDYAPGRGPMTKATVALALAALLLDGCVALGWRFGPGASLGDSVLGLELFAEPPVLEHRGGDYFLSWTQGRYPFFFEPDYKAMDNRLVFAMVATASSGNLAGQHREVKIEGAPNLSALQRGGACWWEREPEPTGRCVRLKIVE
jgi:hypothetical protein